MNFPFLFLMFAVKVVEEVAVEVLLLELEVVEELLPRLQNQNLKSRRNLRNQQV